MKYFLYIAAFLLLSSCKTTNLFMEKKSERNNDVKSIEKAFLSPNSTEYKIRTGDKLNISVWGQEELSVGSVYGSFNSDEVYGKWLLVDANGSIEIPKVGSMLVANKSVTQLKDTLKKIYASWVIHPIVDVKVLNMEITVLGEVRNPQVIQMDKESYSLLEIIGKSGGFDFYANLKYVKVLRQEGANVRVANVNLSRADAISNRNLQLFPGDVVIVPSKKNKEFDKRISTILPFTSVLSAAAILLGIF